MPSDLPPSSASAVHEDVVLDPALLRVQVRAVGRHMEVEDHAAHVAARVIVPTDGAVDALAKLVLGLLAPRVPRGWVRPAHGGHPEAPEFDDLSLRLLHNVGRGDELVDLEDVVFRRADETTDPLPPLPLLSDVHPPLYV